MIALVNYKGNQILIKEGESVKIPYQKDLKHGKTIEFNEVLYFDDGKKKQIGRPYLKSIILKGIVDSLGKESKVVVFQKKRRKGYHKKNGHRQQFTMVEIEKLKTEKTAATTKLPYNFMCSNMHI